MQDVEPEAGGVANRGLVTYEYTVELLFDPLRRTIHHIDSHSRVKDRFVSGVPETIVNLGLWTEERAAKFNWDVSRGVDVEIEIRLRIAAAGAARSGENDRRHAVEFAKLFGK